MERWHPSLQPLPGCSAGKPRRVGVMLDPPGAGDGRRAPLGTASPGVRQRDSPHWEYSRAFALKRPLLSSPEASLLLLLVQDLFFHVW